MIVLGILIGIILLVVMVVLHELGHAIAARRNGVIVEEFGVGFPPRAWARKLKNGVLFTVNWLPLGGFVKLQGENDTASRKGDYGAASVWVKTKILLAGVVVNWLTAALLLSILSATGLPKLVDNQFQMPGDTIVTRQPVKAAYVVEGMPADEIGLRSGDTLVRFAGLPVDSPEDLTQLSSENRGKEVRIIYARDDIERQSKVTLRDSDEGDGYLGVAPEQRTILKSTWSAPIVGTVTTAQLSWLTLSGLGQTVADLASGVVQRLNFADATARQDGSEKIGDAGSAVSGPVGILGVIFPAAVEDGPTSIVLLTAIISMTLAIMNTLPIPALDGGRLFLTLVFRVLLRRPLRREIEERVNSIGFISLMALIVLVTVADVGKLL